jgi:hypothetical protein
MGVKPVPEGCTSVTPWIISQDTAGDAVHRRAVEAGGESVTEVTHLFFGDRVGRVRDPFGNLYWIRTRIEDVSEAEMERRLGDPVFTEAMDYVTGVEFFPVSGPVSGPGSRPVSRPGSLPGR